VRTSCESLSCDFFSLGLAALILGSSATEAAQHRRSYPWPTLAISGLCCGMAFEFRYQIAFAVAGLVFWVLCVSSEDRRRAIRNVAMMFAWIAVPLALGTLVDHWGYGQWAFAPWNYFRTQLLEGIAAKSGTAPFGSYLLLMNWHPLAPLSLVITAAMLIAWVRHPRHIITWATIPFFVGHNLVGHKEVRYLFPMALMVAFLLVLAVAPTAGPQPALLRRFWERRRAWPAKVLYAINFLALAAVCLRATPSSLAIQKYIYDHYPQGCQVYVLGTKSPYENVGYNMLFYRPPGLAVTHVADQKHLQALLENGPSHFLLITDRGSTPAAADAETLPQSAVVYRTYPQWLEKYDYFGWQRHTEFFRVCAVEAVGDSPATVRISGAAAVGNHPRVQ
jgi:phosphatidylinositol glycan class B